MNFFINAVSWEWKLILFDSEKNIISQKSISLLLNESSKLGTTISDFLKQEQVSYNDIQNIVVVHGPGSFTWIRAISLYVNTIAFIYQHIHITPISFFDLYNKYPIVKQSSKRDLFVKIDKNGIIKIMKNEDFFEFLKKSGVSKFYWDTWQNSEFLNSEIDYKEILKNVTFEKQRKINPLYIKKPNIT